MIKLSVILPVAAYNVEWLDHAIESTNGLADELIVITDAGAQFHPILANHPLVTAHLTIERPGGVTPAVNAGIAISTGTHYALMGSDDYFLPEAIELKKHLSPMVDIAYGRVQFSGMLSGEWPQDDDMSQIEKENRIPAGAFTHKRIWYDMQGITNVRYPDWEFWKRVVASPKTYGRYFSNTPFYHTRTWSKTIGASYGYRSDLGHDWGNQPIR